MTSGTDSTGGRAPAGDIGGAAEFNAAPWEPIGARVAAEMADFFVELVGIESATHDHAWLSRMTHRLVELFSPFGPIARHPIGPGGASRSVLSVDGAAPVAADRLPHAAVLGRYDRVWPKGSIERSPARVDSAATITGPGCFDMKGGLVRLYYALAELRRLGRSSHRPVRILLQLRRGGPQPYVTGPINELAAAAGMAYVLESPPPAGGRKTARMGAAVHRSGNGHDRVGRRVDGRGHDANLIATPPWACRPWTASVQRAAARSR